MNSVSNCAFGAILLAAFAIPVKANILDFERVHGAIPCEGMSISNQFQAQFGISFRLAEGGFPMIARKGPPQAAFNVSNVTPTLYDTLHPSDPRAGLFGDFFLADDVVPNTAHTIILDFAAPCPGRAGTSLISMAQTN